MGSTSRRIGFIRRPVPTVPMPKALTGAHLAHIAYNYVNFKLNNIYNYGVFVGKLIGLYSAYIGKRDIINVRM